MSVITEKAYAKLNLCLKVGERAENGYHFVESVMQTISLFDTVTVEDAKGISVVSNSKFLPANEKNIAYRAALLFFEESGINGGARIGLEKRIPVCAGLGGGSADAAAVLRALNKIHGGVLSKEALLKIAARLGADVPFCVYGGTAFAFGFGEKLSSLPEAKLYYVLVTDSVPLSTPQMYKELDGGERTEADASLCKAAIIEGDLDKAARLTCNSFLALALKKCPKAEKSLSLLKQNGALGACITGKGPTVFGSFTSKESAQRCHAAIKGSVFCESVVISE